MVPLDNQGIDHSDTVWEAGTVHVVISCLAHLWLATGWFLIEHLINLFLFFRRYIWMTRTTSGFSSHTFCECAATCLYLNATEVWLLHAHQLSIFWFISFFSSFFFQHVDQRNPRETSLFRLSAPHLRCECMREACRGKRRSPVMLCMHPKERRQIKTTLLPSVYPKVFRGKINFPEREEAGCRSLPRQLSYSASYVSQFNTIFIVIC